jgi:hypothetical protein
MDWDWVVIFRWCVVVIQFISIFWMLNTHRRMKNRSDNSREREMDCARCRADQLARERHIRDIRDAATRDAYLNAQIRLSEGLDPRISAGLGPLGLSGATGPPSIFGESMLDEETVRSLRNSFGLLHVGEGRIPIITGPIAPLGPVQVQAKSEEKKERVLRFEDAIEEKNK